MRAVDLRTGRVLWSTTTPVDTPPDGVVPATVFVVADEAIVIDGATVSRLSLADGSVIAGAATMRGLQLAPEGSHAEVTTEDGADGALRTTLVAGSGHDVTVPGIARSATADDGSLGALLLTQDGKGALHAYDGRTGKPRWTAAVTFTGTSVVLGGTVYGPTSGGVAALDGTTGRVLWRAEVGSIETDNDLFTDGFHLLVSAIDPTRGGELDALDKKDGHLVWHNPLPSGIGSTFYTLGNALIGFGDSALVRIG